MERTYEGAMAYEDAISKTVTFFSKAGSLYDTTKKHSYYGNDQSALDLFMESFKEDSVTSIKLLFWLRDCRGGAGNRSGFRSIIKWLANTKPEWIRANLSLIPLYGRFDDLKVLFNTPLRQEAGIFWGDAIDNGDVLASKWAKREYRPIREALGLKESEFRKLLSNLRKNHIVEHKMCQNQWGNIEYKTVPSVAMARYSNAFGKHDKEGFDAYKEALKSGRTEVKADVLFPHDCIRTAIHGDPEMGEAQFNALPNFLEGTDEKIMVICDTSGSMGCVVGGSVHAIHVSQGMALYCSSRVPENSPFYKRFIAFGSEGRFVDWRKHTFKTALRDRKVFDGAVASTRVDKALDLILDIATERDIKQELMPTSLLIVSDMQFSDGACGLHYKNGRYVGRIENKEALTEVERSLCKWDEAGYKRPKIIYWDTLGYKGTQDTVNSNNVGLVSGFSPAILKAIFSGDKFDPYSIMCRALEKYEITVPIKGENIGIRT